MLHPTSLTCDSCLETYDLQLTLQLGDFKPDQARDSDSWNLINLSGKSVVATNKLTTAQVNKRPSVRNGFLLKCFICNHKNDLDLKS